MENKIYEEKNDIMNIGNFVNLKKQGSNYVCSCPFHNEKTASFVVSPQKNIFKCFGCGKSGDYISFIAYKDGLSRKEAYYKVMGIEKRVTVKPSKEIYDIVQTYYNLVLNRTDSGDRIVKYLNKRGFTNEEIEFFKLGYVENKTKEVLEQVGKERNIDKPVTKALYYGILNNSLLNPLYKRLTFPIQDSYGNIVGYTARRTVDDENYPKYLNTPETIDFKKREELFNLFNAIPAIKRTDKVIIVEGTFDAMSYYVSGAENVVATLGTSLSKEHLMKLKEYTNNIILAYDNDEAGRKNTIRAWILAKEMGFDAKAILLPNGKDANEFMIKNGRNELFKYSQKELTIYGFIRKNKINIKNKNLIFECLSLESSFDQEMLIPNIAKALKINIKVFKEEFIKYENKKDFVYWFECVLYHLLKDKNNINIFKNIINEKFLNKAQKKTIEQIINGESQKINYIQNGYNFIDCVCNFIKAMQKEMIF